MIFPEGWYLYDPEDDGLPISDATGFWFGPRLGSHRAPKPLDDEVSALARIEYARASHLRPVTHYDAQAIFDMAMARAAVEGT